MRAHGVVGVLLVKTESEKLGSDWLIHPERAAAAHCHDRGVTTGKVTKYFY